MNLLDKLKIKPIPKKKEQFNIKIVQPPTTTISITEDDNEVEKSRKTKIIDKTNTVGRPTISKPCHHNLLKLFMY